MIAQRKEVKVLYKRFFTKELVFLLFLFLFLLLVALLR